MNISILDTLGILSERQKEQFRRRLYYSLLRFERRINGASVKFSREHNGKRVACKINVSVEGVGIIAIKRSCVSPEKVLNQAVDAVEPNIAWRIDWRAWLNVDTFATWLNYGSHAFDWALDFGKIQSASNRRSCTTQL